MATILDLNRIFARDRSRMSHKFYPFNVSTYPGGGGFQIWNVSPYSSFLLPARDSELKEVCKCIQYGIVIANMGTCWFALENTAVPVQKINAWGGFAPTQRKPEFPVDEKYLEEIANHFSNLEENEPEIVLNIDEDACMIIAEKNGEIKGGIIFSDFRKEEFLNFVKRKFKNK